MKKSFEEKVDDMIKKIDNGDFDNVIEERINKWEENRRLVASDAYHQWLVDFISKTKYKGFADDDYDYKRDEISDEDFKKVNMLSWFIEYVTGLAGKQRVMSVTDEDNYFETINYDIEMKGLFYNVSTMVGQGTVNFIFETKEPDHCYVRIIPQGE